MPPVICFNIDRNLDIVSALAGFSHFNDWQGTQTQPLESTFYDTFDWRLHNASLKLVMEKYRHDSRLILRDNKTSQALEWSTVEEEPDFASNLPASKLKDTLVPLTTVRRLLPVIQIKQHIQSFALMNNDEKIIVKIQKETSRAISPKTGKAKTLTPRVRVQALKGYSKPYNDLVGFCRNKLRLEQSIDLLEEAIAAHEITPGSYSSKLKFKLDSHSRSDAAVKQFLAVLLQTMENNEAGIEADIDTEFLHDFRVAGRRSRSAIGQIKQVMPVRTLDRLKRDFTWLNQVTGPSRDMDVYLLNFHDYQSSLPEKYQADLDPLQDFLRDHKREEYKKLVRALHSARYRKFKAFLRKYINAPVVERTTLVDAKQPIPKSSGKRIWRIFRRVIQEGKAITNDSPNEALHELRKTCKKLRYLLEFCRSIYPKKDMNHLLKSLKKLQDNLGEFQDYSIQVESLNHFEKQMVEENRATEKSLNAMDELVNILENKQQKIRKVFHHQFKQFSSKDNHVIFNKLFKPEKKTSAK